VAVQLSSSTGSSTGSSGGSSGGSTGGGSSSGGGSIGGGSSSGGGSTGGGTIGGTTTNNGLRTRPVADPTTTGVAKTLNTTDHTAYLSGYDTGAFGVSDGLTRGQVALIFYRMLKNTNVTITKHFPDVTEGWYYTTAVETLASMGIISGYDNGNFGPNDYVTREQFIAIAIRFATLNVGSGVTFSDVATSWWSYQYIASAVNYGWIDGYSDGTFKPSAIITRGEVAYVVNNVLGRVPDQTSIDAKVANRVTTFKTFTDVPVTNKWYYDVLEAANAHNYVKSNGVETWSN
jgi:hypothetical protein